MTDGTPIAVVTGAPGGIGGAVARLFSARGMNVLAVGRSSDRLDVLSNSGSWNGGAVVCVAADVTTDEGHEAIRSAAAHQPLVALVHAAGVESVTRSGATTRTQAEQVLGVNLLAPILLTGTLLPLLADRSSITFIGSIAAVRGRDRRSVYGAAKAGLIGLTRNLAVELAPSVRVNCVVPGATNTRMFSEYVDAYLAGDADGHALQDLEADAGRVLLRRIAEPVEVATTIAHVALDPTAMTGAVVPVDLGFTAR